MFMFDFQPSSQWQHWRGSSGPWVQGALLIFVPLFPSHSTLFPEPHLLYLLRRKKPYYLQSLAGQGSRRSLRSSKRFSISIVSLCWLTREGKFSPSQGQFSHGMTASRGYEANTCFPSKRTLWSIHRYTLFPNGPWMCLLGLVFNGYIYCFLDRSKNFPRPFLYIDILGIYA